MELEIDSRTKLHDSDRIASTSFSHRLQSVSRAYKKQSTLTRSRSNTAASTKDGDTVAETDVPYHTIIIDCAPITFVDSMGIRALYQVLLYVLHCYFVCRRCIL